MPLGLDFMLEHQVVQRVLRVKKNKKKQTQKPHKEKIAVGCGKVMSNRRKVTKHY